MEDLVSSDLKTILHSKRANVFNLEYFRVMQKDGRVLYLTESEKSNQYFNILIANTTVIILWHLTSITQAAVRTLAKAGVLVGMGNDIERMTPQSEYRPTEYLQGWVGFWFDDEKRLEADKKRQTLRIQFLKKNWSGDRELKAYGFDATNTHVDQPFQEFEAKIQSVDNGNYLTYGLAALTLLVLGIPHGFAVMHGKTRCGALVFDVADLIKDAVVLPWMFICAKENDNEQAFRQQILQSFTQHKALDFQFNTIKDIALSESSLP